MAKVTWTTTVTSWVPDSIELVQPGVKVGKSPAYEAGEVYPLDLSSVITGSAMLAGIRHFSSSFPPTSA